MPEGLLDDGEVNVLSHQRKSQRVLEAMRMPPIRWQPGAFSNVLEDPEELATVELAALLTGEHVISGIFTLGKPSTQYALL